MSTAALLIISKNWKQHEGPSTVEQINKPRYPHTMHYYYFFFCLFRAAPAAYGSSLAYTTATATQDVSLICDLHHSSQPHQIPDRQSKARD